MTTVQIQPIETSYRGYRFRSRLEARWAVFFEHLGIAWRYEAEGYVLSDGTRYLPDFYLPDQRTFVEIKPGNGKVPKARSVYFAGKIHKSDWRHEIEPAIRDGSWGDQIPINHEHDYVGPYFVGCDHGCTHGDRTHGTGLSGCRRRVVYRARHVAMGAISARPSPLVPWGRRAGPFGCGQLHGRARRVECCQICSF